MADEHPLSDAQIEFIADRAATKALEKIYADVGKNVVRKMLWIVGLISFSLLMWLAGKGALKP